MDYPHISHIRNPEDVKALDEASALLLAEDIRRFLLDKVQKNGGHLASNLGVVELTMAMHRVFSSPKDRFIFDVGHQSYVHKILTGRADAFDTLRQPGGLSGFPVIRESEHDPFGTGHSSTSLSAALGFAEADALLGRESYTVAVIGDGAMTGGMIHEALNNCKKTLRMVIILNDNGMSISRNIGRFSSYLSRIRVARHYRMTKRRAKKLLSHIPLVGKPLSRLISRVKKWLKRQLYVENYFEDLGILYLGPIDGHDLPTLERTLREAKENAGTVLVHVRTKKGKGCPSAEKNPTAYHGVAAHSNAPVPFSEEGASSFHKVAADTLCEMAREDESICAVTAAMGEGTGLVAFAEAYPERFFDVGIAEAHALTFSAGLCAAGLKPYFAVYSTFLQRAYDNLLHDAALQGLPVRLLVDRAGIAVSDGATHHGIFDVAYASTIPSVAIWAPASYASLREMMRESVHVKTPLIIRYPNAEESSSLTELFYKNNDFANLGLRLWGDESPSIAIVTYGQIACEAVCAARELQKEGVRVRVILLEKLAPYAESAAALECVLPMDCPLVFLEEGIYRGGAGMQLALAFVGSRHPARVLAIKDTFAVLEGEGTPYKELGIDRDAVLSACRSLLY